MSRLPRHDWTTEEKEYLKEITPGRHHKEILELLNKKFQYQFNINQVRSAIKRNKVYTGFTGRFEKGNVPFNKGKKGLNPANSTSFKKGNIPANYKPVGTERIDVDGYVLVKTKDPNTWKLKHRVIYEEHFGKIPKGHVLVFLDRNKQNFNLDNLILVNRNELLILNRYYLLFKDEKLNRVTINFAKLKQKIIDKEKEVSK